MKLVTYFRFSLHVSSESFQYAALVEIQMEKTDKVHAATSITVTRVIRGAINDLVRLKKLQLMCELGSN